MEYQQVDSIREYMARLETGSDWRTEIEDLAREENIEAG